MSKKAIKDYWAIGKGLRPTGRGSHWPKTGQYEHQKNYIYNGMKYIHQKKLKSNSLYIKS